MILAGIDEAGYGPLLGPLVVGCAAFEFDADPAAALPCLWKSLRKVVGKTRSKTGAKLHVNDSKLVYSPSAGLKELERSVLAFAASVSEFPTTLDQLIHATAGHAVADLAEHDWYAPSAEEPFPLSVPMDSARVVANGLRAELARCGVSCVHLAARVLPERQYNRQVAMTHNKGSVLFSTAAIHLHHLLTSFGDKGLVVFCDRQGGRGHYGPLLRQLFEEWSLTIVDEIGSRAEYELARGGSGPPARVIFTEKAEAQCLPVALASMLCKYLRESLMARFNGWWSARVPDLKPTAGYYNDGLRFLADIETARAALGIADEILVRSR